MILISSLDSIDIILLYYDTIHIFILPIISYYINKFDLSNNTASKYQYNKILQIKMSNCITTK